MTRLWTILSVLTGLCASFFDQSAVADVIMQYNEYSGSLTIGRGHGTSTDQRNPGYRAMRFPRYEIRMATGLPNDKLIAGNQHGSRLLKPVYIAMFSA